MWVTEAFKWGRRIFIMVKGMLILYFTGKAIKRYENTRKYWFSFETMILFGIAILDLVLMIFELYHDLNLILAVFTLNSLMQLSSSHFLFTKSLKSMKLPDLVTM